jgi:hypothetical protein
MTVTPVMQRHDHHCLLHDNIGIGIDFSQLRPLQVSRQSSVGSEGSCNFLTPRSFLTSASSHSNLSEDDDLTASSRSPAFLSINDGLDSDDEYEYEDADEFLVQGNDIGAGGDGGRVRHTRRQPLEDDYDPDFHDEKSTDGNGHVQHQPRRPPMSPET